MKKYVIIPSCSDLNRGDQALVWETKKIAEESGFTGKYFFQTEQHEPNAQSVEKGLTPICPLLEHPSRKTKHKDNIRYTRVLKLQWGVIAFFDLLMSLLILFKPTRSLIIQLQSEEKRYSCRIFEESDAVFMKGGGLLQTYGGLSSTYSMYFWTYPILLAHALHKPVYVMPNSFGPFEGPFVRKIAKKVLEKCKVLTARESISQSEVKKELGISLEVCADLAFNLTPSCLEKENFFSTYKIPSDKTLVCITMRPYRFPRSNNSEEAYRIFKREMAKFITWLSNQGYMPILTEHTLALNTHENDKSCIEDVVKLVDSKNYILISNSNYNCEDLKKIYGFFDYIVGTRFHSMIFSFGNCIPGIAISYTGNKSIGIMHDMGLEDYVIDIENLDERILKEKFCSLVSNRDQVYEHILNYLNKANSQRDSLKRVLTKEAEMPD